MTGHEKRVSELLIRAKYTSRDITSVQIPINKLLDLALPQMYYINELEQVVENYDSLALEIAPHAEEVANCMRTI